MSDTVKSRSSKYTHTQKEAMVDFMELNPQLRRGKFTKEFTAKMAEKLWQDLCDLLNSLPGSQKDISQWRKTWQDLKTTVKDKSTLTGKESKKTGGGKATTIVLSELETRVCSLIGSTTIKGDPRIQESVVKMNWKPARSNISTAKSVTPIILSNASDEDEFLEYTPSTRNRQSSTTTIPAPLPAGISSPDLSSQLPSRQEQRSPANSSENLFRPMSNSLAADSPQHPSASLFDSQHVAESISSPVAQQHLFEDSSTNYLADLLSGNEDLQQNSSATQPVTQSYNSRVMQRRLSSNSRISQFSRLSSNRVTQRHSSANSNISQPCQRSMSSSPYRLQRPTRVTTQHQPRRVATQRLDNTIYATDSLIEAIQRKADVKESYYRDKLELIETNVSAQQRIAASLEAISSFMNQI